MIDPLEDVDAVAYHLVPTTASTIPALPTFPNPGQFKILNTWTDKQRRIEKIEHDQKMEQYLIAQHVDNELVMLYSRRSSTNICR